MWPGGGSRPRLVFFPGFCSFLNHFHGVQRRMISVINFFVFLRLFFASSLLYVT